MTFEEKLQSVKFKIYSEIARNTEVEGKDDWDRNLYTAVAVFDKANGNTYAEQYEKDVKEYQYNSENYFEFFEKQIEIDEAAAELARKDTELHAKSAVVSRKLKSLMAELKTLNEEMANITDEAELEYYRRNQTELTDKIREVNALDVELTGRLSDNNNDIRDYVAEKLTSAKESIEERKERIEAYKVFHEAAKSSKPDLDEIRISFREIANLHEAYKQEFGRFRRFFSFLPGTAAYKASRQLEEISNVFLKRCGIDKSDLEYYFKTGSKINTLYDKVSGYKAPQPKPEAETSAPSPEVRKEDPDAVVSFDENGRIKSNGKTILMTEDLQKEDPDAVVTYDKDGKIASSGVGIQMSNEDNPGRPAGMDDDEYLDYLMSEDDSEKPSPAENAASKPQEEPAEEPVKQTVEIDEDEYFDSLVKDVEEQEAKENSEFVNNAILDSKHSLSDESEEEGFNDFENDIRDENPDKEDVTSILK